MTMPTLYTGIKQLLTFSGDDAPRSGEKMKDVGLVENAAVLTENGIILSAGPRSKVMRHKLAKKARVVEIGGVCIPSFVDSHTHTVFAEPRLKDFSMRTSGMSYSEIKNAGGGILSSIKSVRKQPLEEMTEALVKRSRRFLEYGTATVEIKSGYGLDKQSEMKVLKAISDASKKTYLTMIPTLLAAHSVPPEFKGNADKYLDYIEEKIFPAVAENKLAVFADVFCEEGFFNPAQATRYLKSAAKYGMLSKIHSEQLSNYGGTYAAASIGAISADHADYVNDKDIEAMKESGTIATLLPASNYFMGLKYPQAGKLIKSGVPVALATDFNPGTSPCMNMQFVLSCACVNCGITPEEALCAATINGAKALCLNDRGMIVEGKRADLTFFEANDYRELCYYFGSSLCSITVVKGEIVFSRKRRFPVTTQEAFK